ncbi:MAG: hypothetical protein KKH72_01290 [Alphaproteobacteria bacterium]|nr:hypothetical protein [Alphaproteobacteria bacterium]
MANEPRWYTLPGFRIMGLSALVIGGCFWLALHGYQDAMFVVVPFSTIIGAVVIGLYANSFLEAERTRANELQLRLMMCENSRKLKEDR